MQRVELAQAISPERESGSGNLRHRGVIVAALFELFRRRCHAERSGADGPLTRQAN